MNEQDQLGPSGDGSVVLDIGGNIGALIINTTAELAGREIEVSPSIEPTARIHVAVRERRGPRGTRFAAIYPRLPAGEVTIWADDHQIATTVHIVGGQVTQLKWNE